MVDHGISLRVQQMGAENVRARLREINAELKAGKPITSELKKEMGELSTQLGAQGKIVRLTEQAWKNNHARSWRPVR